MDRATQAVAYIRAIERGAVGDELAAFFHPDVVIVEMPNRFRPEGKQSDLAAALAAAHGRTMMRSQTYDIQCVTAEDDRVVVEIAWTGVLAAPMGPLAAGDAMRARSAIVLEFTGERIRRQRHYDSYEAF